MTLRRAGQLGRRIYLFVTIGLVVAAVANELRRPAEQRTWQGRIAGVVPYSFRPPGMSQLRQDVWNPDSEQVLRPRSFGVGWSLNFAEVIRRLRNRKQVHQGSRAGALPD